MNTFLGEGQTFWVAMAVFIGQLGADISRNIDNLRAND